MQSTSKRSLPKQSPPNQSGVSILMRPSGLRQNATRKLSSATFKSARIVGRRLCGGIIGCVFAIAVAGCASTSSNGGADARGDDRSASGGPDALYDPAPTPRWAGYGYFGSSGEPTAQRLIDVYQTRRACEAGVEAWTSRQVAGTLVWGECLPVDQN